MREKMGNVIDELNKEIEKVRKEAEDEFMNPNGMPYGDDAVMEYLNKFLKHERNLAKLEALTSLNTTYKKNDK